MAETEYGRGWRKARGSAGRVAGPAEMRRAPRAGLCIEWLAVVGKGEGERISILGQSETDGKAKIDGRNLSRRRRNE